MRWFCNKPDKRIKSLYWVVIGAGHIEIVVAEDAV